jgi:hypothetical protein
MKKTSLSILSLICFSIFSQAQINKGTVLLGGGVSGNAYKWETSSNNAKTTGFVVYPSIGLAVKDNLVIGVKGGYAQSVSEYNGSSENQPKYHDYSGGFFLRRYVPLGKSFYLFGEVGAVYTQSKMNQYFEYSPGMFGKTTQVDRSIGFSVYPGITYTVNKNIHLELGMNNLVAMSFTESKAESDAGGIVSSSKSRGLSFSSSMSASVPFTVGFRIALAKKGK